MEDGIGTAQSAGFYLIRIKIPAVIQTKEDYHKRQFILADEVKANLDAKNQEKINQLLFSLPQAVVEVIHHYTKEDLKRYDKVIHLKK